MSNIKFSEDLFLEKEELNRFKRFISTDGFKQNLLLNTVSFGLLKGHNLPAGINIEAQDDFRVDNIGSSSNAVNIRPGRAISKFGEIITLDNSRTIQIPNTGLWYWIKIKHRYVNTEIGTVSIDANGNLSGFGTKFTEILRGQPNFPAKIKFSNTLGNNLEYEVVDVISDSSAVISGDFVPETNLNYSVVGTFTPGYNPINQDKFIFEYDDVEISIIAEDPSAPTVSPSKADDEEFWVARLRTAGLNVEIQDKRTEFWRTKSNFEITYIDRAFNPIIGVESVKCDISTTPRDRNEVNIFWGYRSDNWSVDTTQNLVTINSGLGGILKENDLTEFTNGIFDGWRLYVKSGRYFKITSSSKTGTQLNLRLDYLDFKEFITDSLITIVPDVEEIEIKAKYNETTGINHIIEENFKFPIYFSGGKCYVRIVDSKLPYLYNFTYRYKTFKEYTDWQVFPNDLKGFYSEKSFEENGEIKLNVLDREQKPYNGHISNGFIEIIPHPRNWNIFFDEIMTGDKFGVEHKNLTNADILMDLVVGQDRQMQVLHANGLQVANDIFINLNKIRHNGLPCINGNRFIIQIEGTLELNGRNIRVVTDFIDPTNYTLIREVKEEDVIFIRQSQQKQKSGLVMIYSYDGTDWILSISNEMNGVPKNSIIMYGGDLSAFDSSGLGIIDEVRGWALCNGNYGTRDMRSKVPVGYSDVDIVHQIPWIGGGSKNAFLTQAQMPNYTLPSTSFPHAHKVTGRSASRNTSGSGYNINQVHIGGPNLSDSAITNTTSVSATVQVSTGGQNQPVSIMQPYMNSLFIQKII